MKIIPLSEGSFTIDKSKLFVPFDKSQDELQARAKGSLLVEIQPFVIVCERDVLLLDTGLGFEKQGEMQLHANLKNAGIQPADITKVLLTHLHKDHAGGVSKGRSHESLSFPDAMYYVQRRELAYAFEKGFPSFIPGELTLLHSEKNIHLLDDNEGTIDGYIRYQVSGAHSPFHQVFWISEGDKTIFFGGDEAPQLQQMKHRFVAKYDHDGKKAMELRKQWWQQGRQDGWIFLFYHDISTPIYPNSQ